MQEQLTPNHGDAGKPELDYRKEDISDTKLFLYIGSGFVIFILLLVALIFAFSGKTEKKLSGTAGIAEQKISLQKQEDSVLSTYQLIDSANRIYRIPIDSAMALLLAETVGQNLDPTRKSP
jgi:hypothetical protein